MYIVFIMMIIGLFNMHFRDIQKRHKYWLPNVQLSLQMSYDLDKMLNCSEMSMGHVAGNGSDFS